MPYWSAHTHSRYSAKDALPTVEDMVSVVSKYQQPALGLTDHGTIAGIWQLYKECKAQGIMPVPGIEAYVSVDRATARPSTTHLGILATTSVGWENLIHLNNMMHRNYRYKPLIDINDLYSLSGHGLLDGLSVTTGCFFGMLITALRNGGPLAATNVIAVLTDLFNGRVYIETQHHNIEDDEHNDDDLIEHLIGLADKHGLPTVITSDSHYLYPNDKIAHDMLKRLGSWSDDVDSAPFPGDGYHLCTDLDMKLRFEPDVYRRGVQGLEHMLFDYDIKVPELDTFTAQVPEMPGIANEDEYLRERCHTEVMFSDNIPIGKHRDYIKRLDKELDVITKAGFSGYILLTAQVTDYMRSQNIMFNARGSASGSLVCWLLGITSVDPLQYELSFERFLTGDRAKPPDIDLDVEHKRREQVIHWLYDNYACAQISTWRELKLSGSDDEYDDQKGSLWIKWAMLARKLGNDPTVIGDEDFALLNKLSDMRALDGVGIHTAGVLVTSDMAALSRVPMQYVASSETFVTGPDKKGVEGAGYVKLDLLGLKTLTSIRIAFEIAGVSVEEIDETNYRNSRVYRRISSGRTEGMFQLSGRAAQIGSKDLKPTTFDDLVASMALFRPAAQGSGATAEFIKYRRTDAKRKKHHEIIERHCASTQGVLLYQEQLIEILRDLGMDSARLNDTLKAVKASNASTTEARLTMERTVDVVANLATAAGMSVDDVIWLRNAMTAYSEYGFNKAHAVAYARMAYITGWLAVHHPAAFWTGVLTVANAKEQVRLERYAKKDNVFIAPPHVNESGIDYTCNVQKNIIRKGLQTIKGVGEKACNSIVANAPYTSIMDLAERSVRRHVTGSNNILQGHTPDSAGGVISKLYDAGALEGLPLNESMEEEVQ